MSGRVGSFRLVGGSKGLVQEHRTARGGKKERECVNKRLRKRRKRKAG